MAPKFEWQIDQGSDFTKFYRFKDANGDFEAISGSVWSGQMKADFTSSVAATFGVSINDEDTAEIVIVLVASGSRDLDAGQYVADIYQTLAGSRTRRLQANVELTPEVTRT